MDGRFLLSVVALMTMLTLFGKKNGEAPLFLVGTITGYLIVMIQQLVILPIEDDKSE